MQAWLRAVADRRVCDALKSQQRLKRSGQLRRAASIAGRVGPAGHWLSPGMAEGRDFKHALRGKESERRPTTIRVAGTSAPASDSRDRWAGTRGAGQASGRDLASFSREGRVFRWPVCPTLPFIDLLV